MEGYQTEEQRVAELKKLWAKYAKYILLAVLVIFLALFANYFIAKHQATKNRESSELYSQMLNLVEKNEQEQVATLGKQLVADYQSTPYSLLAGMMLAKLKVEEGDIPAAVTEMQQVTSKKHKSNPMWSLAKIRLARLLHHTGESTMALAELNGLSDDYIALYEEVKGDIYAELNDMAKAKEAYTRAIANSIGENRKWLKAKLSEVSGS